MFNCCSISPNIREGLLEVFYGVYEKDPDKVTLFHLTYPSLLLFSTFDRCDFLLSRVICWVLAL